MGFDDGEFAGNGSNFKNMITLQDESYERAHTTNRTGKRKRLNPLISPSHAEKQEQYGF